jgi:hypothetical protein
MKWRSVFMNLTKNVKPAINVVATVVMNTLIAVRRCVRHGKSVLSNGVKHRRKQTMPSDLRRPEVPQDPARRNAPPVLTGERQLKSG